MAGVSNDTMPCLSLTIVPRHGVGTAEILSLLAYNRVGDVITIQKNKYYYEQNY